MSTAVKHRVFYYHAGASAVGGAITHPEKRLVRAGGSCSLAQAGGETGASLEDFRFGDVLQVRRASTHATGATHAAGGWTTLVTATVEGLNLLDVLTAERITARLSVEHLPGDHQPRVSVLGSSYINLRLGGQPLVLPPACHCFQRLERRKDKPWPASDPLLELAKQKARVIAAESSLPDSVRERYSWLLSEREAARRGYIVCSVVDAIQNNLSGKATGHILTVPGFGRLFFGEFTVTHDSFRLVMVRAELGCSVDGDLSFACADSNGAPMP